MKQDPQTIRVGPELVVELNQDGTVLLGDENKNPAATLTAAMIIGDHWRRIGTPGLIVNLGLDDHYVWPPFTRKKKPAGFDCPHCRRAVKRALCPMGKIFLCYCMGVVLTRQWMGREPRNGKDWTEARQEGIRRQVMLEARTAKGDN
jgi:hypothetical protein